MWSDVAWIFEENSRVLTQRSPDFRQLGTRYENSLRTTSGQIDRSFGSFEVDPIPLDSSNSPALDLRFVSRGRGTRGRNGQGLDPAEGSSSAHDSPSKKIKGRGEAPPTCLGPPSPALDPSGEVAQTSEGSRAGEGASNGVETPSHLFPHFSFFFKIKTGEEGRGPPTPLGAPPPTLDPIGSTATSPKGSRPAGEPPVRSGAPPLFPCFSIKKQGKYGRAPNLVWASPAGPRSLRQGGRTQATLPRGSRAGREPLVEVGRLPTPPRKFWAKFSKKKEYGFV
ncbi:hypothetical protein CRG98_000638 [Punica granatum]|uniref:Uncharacterized protein n=1 Tax=Punica granatum TaxID=22663 RepID=A0A2I0LE95_PUNGR|nr:hypothetical protein CRG98_000638 [Punica granatum]